MPQFTCLGHKNHVLCVAWAPNGLTFASADKGGEIRCVYAFVCVYIRVFVCVFVDVYVLRGRMDKV